jgi:ferredoxin-NADP reductase
VAEKRARVTSIQTIARDVVQIDAAMVDPPAIEFQAGQFLSFRIDETGDERRAWTIASFAERTDGFELVVRLLPHRAGSDYVRALRPGSELAFTGPVGRFTPDLAHDGDVVFAATGSGIAAALPMLHEILGRPETGRVLLYWGLRRQEDVYWRDRLEAEAARSARFAWHICLSQPDPGWEGVEGRITGHIVRQVEVAPRLERPVFYVVGNGDMIRELKHELVARGIDRKRQIRVEEFYPATEP